MIEIKVKDIDGLSDIDLLETVYKKVPLWKWVKFNGTKYQRVTPKNNKVVKNPYHFKDMGDIYKGNGLTNDSDDEMVNMVCSYKIVIE